jgi:hypothetical protein
MELSSIQHIEPDQLAHFRPDIFITTLWYESRCTTVSQELEQQSCRKVALIRQEARKDFSYTENKSYFRSRGFEMHEVEGEVPDMDDLLASHKGEHLNMIVDCTSMSPTWYHHFLSWFARMQEGYSRVRMRFAYTMSHYSGHQKDPKVKALIDFLESDQKAPPGKKRALILGLGHERGVGESIFKLVKPDLLYLFYADPPIEKRFVEKVFINNHKLIESMPIRNLVAYPIRNGQSIYQTLIDTILPLRNEYSINLIPHGPKIFSVVAMLLHLGYPDIHISYPVFKKRPISDRLPDENPVVLDVIFEGDE